MTPQLLVGIDVGSTTVKAVAVDAALSRVRPEYREVVVLRYQEGLTHPEIAEILGLPPGTVKTYLHRARKELAAILSEAGWNTNV